MYSNWLVLPHLAVGCLWFCLAGGQMFEQQLTNLIYSNRVGGATDRRPQGLTIQRLPSQMIEPDRLHQHLQEITGSEALAPLLLELLGQSGPNWQGQQAGNTATNQPQQKQQQPQQQQQQAQPQPQQQQPQQQQQHFFVYENSQTAGQTSQQPQILPGFNGVNVHPASQQQGQQLFRAPKPIQAQQQQQQQQQQYQYPETEPKIVKAPPVAAVQAPTSAYIATSFDRLPPGLPSLDPVASMPHSRPAGTQPVSSPSTATAAPASCSYPSAVGPVLSPTPNPTTTTSGMNMPCPSYETTPLLSASVLKATAG
ncbi:transcription factor SPT20 homolog [Drosophila obscura]|uniref:transcription factor SPT20 homolog n=1 Tax=Drosophila obscura TaxID=7282 RepID=UPI001BB1FC38|nr:transcription factor SPT20 homolog [Drosophila obscura]